MRARPLGAILKPLRQRINGKVRIRYPVGCALCQFGAPCMDKNPMASKLYGTHGAALWVTRGTSPMTISVYVRP